MSVESKLIFYSLEELLRVDHPVFHDKLDLYGIY